MTNMDEPPHRLSRILTETYATCRPEVARVTAGQPELSTDASTFWQFPCSCPSKSGAWLPSGISRRLADAGEAISQLISNTVHTFPIYAQFSAPYPEPERRNVPCGIRV